MPHLAVLELEPRESRRLGRSSKRGLPGCRTGGVREPGRDRAAGGNHRYLTHLPVSRAPRFRSCAEPRRRHCAPKANGGKRLRPMVAPCRSPEKSSKSAEFNECSGCNGSINSACRTVALSTPGRCCTELLVPKGNGGSKTREVLRSGRKQWLEPRFRIESCESSGKRRRQRGLGEIDSNRTLPKTWLSDVCPETT